MNVPNNGGGDVEQRAGKARVIAESVARESSATARQTAIAELCGADQQLRELVQQFLQASSQDDLTVGNEFASSTTPSLTVADETFDIAERIGPYRIKQVIGEGGMGIVYLAEQLQPIHRVVALKVIKSGMDTRQVIARFEAERQALAMMNHANIARVLDAGTTDQGRPYFVMELVRGIPITEYCDRHRLDRTERLELFIDVCRAVQHAHQKGVIHRDLKPNNVLVERHDSEHVAKVIDFGLAKATSHRPADQSRITQYSQLIGTPLYMSPEQAELGGLDVDTRSDIYSLGVMLYVLLTGVTPFEREKFDSASLDEIRKMIREDQPQRPSQRLSSLGLEQASSIASRQQSDPLKLRREIKGDLDWVVMKALEKDRNRRYESAGAFASDIRRFLDGHAVEAGAPSLLYRAGKTARRHRLAIAVASFVLIVLTASSLILGWQSIELRRAWMQSAAREARANDLLEGLRFQSSLASFRRGHLSQLADQVESIVAQSLDNGGKSSDRSSAFAAFLYAAAQPRPLTELSNFSPIHDFDLLQDSQSLIAVDQAGELQRWNLDQPNEPPQLIGKHGVPAHAVAVSPDQKWAVSGDTEGFLRWWSLDEPGLVRELKPFENGIETVVWSPDGQYVVAGARYSGIAVFDNQGEKVFRVENDHRHESLLFSPDSKLLYLPTRVALDVWNLETQRKERTISTVPLINVRAMCLAGPEQQWIVAGERFSDLLIVLDRASGQRLGTIVVSSEYARSLSVSGDGMWIAAGYANGQLQLIQLAESLTGSVSGRVLVQFRGHGGADNARTPVDWMSDQPVFLSGGHLGMFRAWDRTTITPLEVRKPPPSVGEIFLHEDSAELSHLPANYKVGARDDFRSEPEFKALAWTDRPRAGRVAAVSEHEVVLLKAKTGELLTKLPSPVNRPKSVSLSPDATRLLVSSDREICVWLQDQTLYRIWRTFSFSHSVAPIFADQGRTIITYDDVRHWVVELDLESGSIQRKHHLRAEHGICVSHDGELLAAATDRGLRVWQRRSGHAYVQRDDLSQPRRLAFFPGDRVLISGDNDGKVRAWHVPTGEALGVLYEPDHASEAPQSLQIHQGGQRILVRYRNHRGLIVAVLGR